MTTTRRLLDWKKMALALSLMSASGLQTHVPLAYLLDEDLAK